MKELSFKTTKEIKVPKLIIDQIIGQEKAIKLLKKIAKQRRHLLLIGAPGTGKSLIAQALSELLPKEKLQDIIAFKNLSDENIPIIKTYPKGKGIDIVNKSRIQSMSSMRWQSVIFFILAILAVMSPWWIRKEYGDIMAAASLISSMVFLIGIALFININRRMNIGAKDGMPKILINNSKSTNAPFIDASGSHSGALFGDVLHDPLQTIFPDTIIYLVNEGKTKSIQLSKFVDEMLEENKDLIERNYEGYEGVIISKEKEFYLLGHNYGKIGPVKITAVNKRFYDGEMYSVKENGFKVVLTPEHKIFTDKGWIEAKDIEEQILMKINNKIIIDEEDILNTFSEKEKQSAINYKRYLELKNKNKEYGYKKLAKLLKIKEGQLRWWHHSNSKPYSIKILEALKDKNLIPLRYDNKNIAEIARILGSTFGDGGIFGNLNAIYLSSSEIDSLKSYEKDLVSLFGPEISKNFVLRISGVNNSGKCLSNTNRKIVRFFAALGSPIGRKDKVLTFPIWVKSNEETKKEFFGALLGNELCSPKFSEHRHYINSLDFALCGSLDLKENRLDLLKEIRLYLNSYGIKCSDNIYENEFRQGRYSWRLCISKEFENLLRFKNLILIRYSDAKVERINNALKEQIVWKNNKQKELLLKGKSIKYINSALRINKGFAELQEIKEINLNDKKIEFKGYIYNITTKSGNLFANNILISNSGGLGTPPHERLIPGFVHRANKGVLFIDEISNLKPQSQQDLLTALQEKKFSITGQSERSSGAMTRSEPVPCDFILVAAGNPETLKHMHPALRSRIRGYGYEIYMDLDMDDNEENRFAIARFVAQEVTKDGKIPHFTKESVMEIINEARKRAGRSGKLTLRLRELGGLIRAAGDLAFEENSKFVLPKHITQAKQLAKTLEQQIADKYIDQKKEYQVITTKGKIIGKVNGLAVLGSDNYYSGIVLPIESEIALGGKKAEFIATGQLGKIAKEAVKNVSAIILKYLGEDIKEKYDIFVQFIQTNEGVEGDSASIAVAAAIVSAVTKAPVRQDYAMTGSLSIKGEVLAIGGVTAKIEAAIEAGISNVIIPKSNEKDVILSNEQLKKIKIIPVERIEEVLKIALDWTEHKDLLKKLK